jgi:HNH endonuclease
MLTQALLCNITDKYQKAKMYISKREKGTLHIVRFLRMIRVSETKFWEGTPCWEWQGTIQPRTGYGQFVIAGHRDGRIASSPHRFAYLYFIGPLPNRFEPDHLCNNKTCASPLHLEAVTHRENCRRRVARTKGEEIRSRGNRCKNGHEQVPLNLTKNGRCRICFNAYHRDRRRKEKDST